MTPTVRPLADDDLPAAWELGRLAFGGPATAYSGCDVSRRCVCATGRPRASLSVATTG